MAAQLTPGIWESMLLPRSTSFKYLGLIFHESGSLSPALARLAQNGKGATALLHQKFKKLMCDRSFPMMRRLFDAIVLPTVSYGCEVWVPDCSRALGPEIKAIKNVQINFFRQLCQLRKSVSPPIIFRGFAERPWLHTWWLRVLGFMHRCLKCLRGVCTLISSRITLPMHVSNHAAQIGPRALQSNFRIWACESHSTHQPLAASITLVSVMLSRSSNKGCGTMFMSPPGLLLQKGPSFARIIAGSARQIGVVLSLL